MQASKIIIVTLLACSLTTAEPNCDKPLSLCREIVAAQGEYIEVLKNQQKELQDKLVEQEPTHPMIWIFLGIIVGGLGYTAVGHFASGTSK